MGIKILCINIVVSAQKVAEHRSEKNIKFCFEKKKKFNRLPFAIRILSLKETRAL